MENKDVLKEFLEKNIDEVRASMNLSRSSNDDVNAIISNLFKERRKLAEKIEQIDIIIESMADYRAACIEDVEELCALDIALCSLYEGFYGICYLG